MNERIKELAKSVQCERHWTEEDIEKFAELIVRECIELNKQELAFNAFERLLNRYKEHFGVDC